MQRLLTATKRTVALCGCLLLIGSSCLFAQSDSSSLFESDSTSSSLFDTPVSELFNRSSTNSASGSFNSTLTESVADPGAADPRGPREFPSSTGPDREVPTGPRENGLRPRPAPLGDASASPLPAQTVAPLGRSTLFDELPSNSTDTGVPAARTGGLAPIKRADVSRDAEMLRNSSVQNGLYSYEGTAGSANAQAIQRVSANSAAAESLLGEPVAAVKVEGNLTIPSYSIERYITNTRVGRPVSAIAIRDDKSALLSTRWFASVREFIEPSPEGPIVIFQVNERPILRNVEFIGNKKFSSDRLRKETGLVPGHGFDVSANHESVVRIERLYREKGYVHVRVQLKKGANSEDREVVIVIDEGPKVAVAWISFEGNEFVSGAVLKTKLTTKTQWFFLFGGTYDPELIRNDEQGLKSYYESLGFFDVQVKGVERAAEDGKRMYITFIIREGVRFKVRNVDTSGNAVLSREQLLRTTKLRPGEPFNSRMLEEDLKEMKGRYDELGRPFAEVQPEPIFLEKSGLMDIVYKINEDKVRYVGRVNIAVRGDMTHTKTDVVRHRINRVLEPGKLAKASDFRAAKAYLNDPIFDREDPASFNITPRDTTDYLPPVSTLRGQSGSDTFSTHKPLRPVEVFHTGAEDGTLWGSPGVVHQFDPQQSPSDSHYRSDSNQSQSPSLPDRGRERRPSSLIETSDVRPTVGTHRLGAPVKSVSASPSPLSQSRKIARPQPLNATQDQSFIANRDAVWTGNPERGIVTAEKQPSAKYGIAQADEITEMPVGNGLDPDEVFRGQSSPAPAQYGNPNGPVDANGYPIVVAQQPGMRGQSVDPYGLPVPQNYMNGVSPQGDPFGNALRNEPPGFVDIDIDVTEGRTGRLMFGAGFNSDAGVVGSIVLQEDNFDILRVPTSWSDITNGLAFRGNGESFRLELVPGNQVSRYNVSWRNPYFLGTDYSLGFDAFYYNRYFQDWTEERTGGRVSVGYLFDRNWSGGITLRLEEVGFHGFRTPAPALYNASRGTNLLSTAQARLTYDARDSAFLPSSGHMLEVAYEQAFGDFNYPHVDVTGSQYFTVYQRPDGGGKHILQFRAQGSWLGDNTPIFERLHAGGFQTFRGFQFRGVSPRDATGTFRLGGTWMAIGSTEYSFPITAGDGIRGVLFSDFGTVDNSVSFDKFRASAGFGFRVSVPAIGPAPLAFDLAWPITAQDEDDKQVFSFYVGSAW